LLLAYFYHLFATLNRPFPIFLMAILFINAGSLRRTIIPPMQENCWKN
jgi:hypothetical protein